MQVSSKGFHARTPASVGESRAFFYPHANIEGQLADYAWAMPTLTSLWRLSLEADDTYKRLMTKYDGDLDEDEWGDVQSDEDQRPDPDQQLDDELQHHLQILKQVRNASIEQRGFTNPCPGTARCNAFCPKTCWLCVYSQPIGSG